MAPDSPEVTQSAMNAVGIDGRAKPMATAKFDLEVVGVAGSGSVGLYKLNSVHPQLETAWRLL